MRLKFFPILLATLMIVLLSSCASSNGGNNFIDPATLPATDQDGDSPLILSGNNRVKVVVWDGRTIVKTVTVFATGETVEQIVDPSRSQEVKDPKITAVAYRGGDFYYVPLTGQYHLAYKDEYLIGPEDELEILVWKNEDLSRKVQVRPDGKITLPLVNDVYAAGFSRQMLQDKLIELFRTFLGEPEITVSIIAANSYKVFVQGRVQQPGAFSILHNTTMVQAIAMAGGFAEWADTAKIMIVRRTPDGETRKIVNYKKIVRENSPEPDVALQPGDTIIVP